MQERLDVVGEDAIRGSRCPVTNPNHVEVGSMEQTVNRKLLGLRPARGSVSYGSPMPGESREMPCGGSGSQRVLSPYIAFAFYGANTPAI